MRAYRFVLPLRKEIQLGNRRVSHREGLLLESNGNWGEASPLPHFSNESFSDVVRCLRDRQTTSPSLNFALDAVSVPTMPCSIPMNALLQGSEQEILTRCEQLKQSPFQAVKLKVGRRPVADDAALVREVRGILRSDQSLRLDANRAWDWSTATQFATAIRDLRIEYIEEPLRDYQQLDAFANQTGVAYALDETLRESVPLEQFQAASAYVIKPTLQGGHDQIVKLAQAEKPLVFSACYESGVGLARIAQLAEHFSPTTPTGLDTYSMLQHDLLMTPHTTEKGYLQIVPPLQIDRRFLQEIHFE